MATKISLFYIFGIQNMMSFIYETHIIIIPFEISYSIVEAWALYHQA